MRSSLGYRAIRAPNCVRTQSTSMKTTTTTRTTTTWSNNDSFARLPVSPGTCVGVPLTALLYELRIPECIVYRVVMIVTRSTSSKFLFSTSLTCKVRVWRLSITLRARPYPNSQYTSMLVPVVCYTVCNIPVPVRKKWGIRRIRTSHNYQRWPLTYHFIDGAAETTALITRWILRDTTWMLIFQSAVLPQEVDQPTSPSMYHRWWPKDQCGHQPNQIHHNINSQIYLVSSFLEARCGLISFQ